MQTAQRAATTNVLPLPKEELNLLVRDVNRLESLSSLSFIHALGQLVIERMYGSLVGWRRQGKRHESYRKLAAHPGLNMSATSLYRALQVFEMLDTLGKQSFRVVCASHLYAVIPLENDLRRQLLERVEEEGLTVRALQTLVRSLSDSTRATGRPRTPEPLRRLQAFCRITDDIKNLDVDRRAFKAMPAEERRKLVAEVNQGLKTLESVRNELVKSIQPRGAWT